MDLCEECGSLDHPLSSPREERARERWGQALPAPLPQGERVGVRGCFPFAAPGSSTRTTTRLTTRLLGVRSPRGFPERSGIMAPLSPSPVRRERAGVRAPRRIPQEYFSSPPPSVESPTESSIDDAYNHAYDHGNRQGRRQGRRQGFSCLNPEPSYSPSLSYTLT